MTAEQNHPITPPPELVIKWADRCNHAYKEIDYSYEEYIATQAARWGADQELEACINEIHKGVGLRHIDYSSNRESLCSDLRAARRPKPPSLKEQALATLEAMEKLWDSCGDNPTDIIRCALEALPD